MVARQLFPCPSEFGSQLRQEIVLKSHSNHRRANGEDAWLSKHAVRLEDLTQTSLPPARAFGQFVRIRLLDNYGDQNYIGLNGLEIYDSQLSPLLQTAKVKFQLVADPVMASMRQTERDSRVPENLHNGKNETSSREQVWMAPFINRWKLGDKMNLGRLFNQIAVFFERPVDIAAVGFWNYSIDPRRGARQAEVYLDEQLVCAVVASHAGLHPEVRGSRDCEDGLARFETHRAPGEREAAQPAEAPARPERGRRKQPRRGPGARGGCGAG